MITPVFMGTFVIIIGVLSTIVSLFLVLLGIAMLTGRL